MASLSTTLIMQMRWQPEVVRAVDDGGEVVEAGYGMAWSYSLLSMSISTSNASSSVSAPDTFSPSSFHGDIPLSPFEWRGGIGSDLGSGMVDLGEARRRFGGGDCLFRSARRLRFPPS